MTDYIPAILTLGGGLLAFFFAKSGEKNKVNGVGWIMATLLVAGGVLGIYVIYAKNRAAERTAAETRQQADKAAVIAGKQSALIMTLIGNFDLMQRVTQMRLEFEFPTKEQGEPPAIAAGFTGPFPRLPNGVVGRFELRIWDFAEAKATFRSDADRIVLTDLATGSNYTLTNERIVPPDRLPETGPVWAASAAEEAPGFTYALGLPVDSQLRRVLYGIVREETLGYIGFPVGSLDAAQLKRIEEGFAANPPALVFGISEPDTGGPCTSNIHIPLRLVRASAPVMLDDKPHDAFELRMTPAGFWPDPCNPGGP